MVVTKVTFSNKARDYTDRLVVNMLGLQVPVPTKLLDKATRAANMEVTRPLAATITVTASNVEDGAATMDTNRHSSVAPRPW